MSIKLNKSSVKLDQVKKDLTFSFTEKNHLGKTITTTVPFYRESQTNIYVPFQYCKKCCGSSGSSSIKPLPEDVNKPCQFVGELKDYQLPIKESVVKEIDENRGALLNIKTGGGKTVLALNIISHYTSKTIIFIHKKFLMDQWVERINQFLPNAKIGFIKAGKIPDDLNDYDIVLAMIQTVALSKQKRLNADKFTLIIIDEVHHVAAEKFSNIFLKLASRYSRKILGLSATVKRLDGLEEYLYYSIGKVIDMDDNFIDQKCVVKTVKHVNDDLQLPKNRAGNLNFPSVISGLIDDLPRNGKIVAEVKRAHKNDRKILILTERLSHTRILFRQLLAECIPSNDIGIYSGETQQCDLAEVNEKRIIIGTYSMCSEGYDCPELNTLVLATPKANVKQSIGRIFRKSHSKPALIVDIFDDQPPFRGLYYKRLKLYREVLVNAKFINDSDINPTPLEIKWELNADDGE